MNIKAFLRNLNNAVQENLGIRLEAKDIEDLNTQAIEGRIDVAYVGLTPAGFIVVNNNMVYAYCGYPKVLPLDKIDKVQEVVESMNKKLAKDSMGKAFINDRYLLINSSAIPLLIINPETKITMTVRETPEDFAEKHGGFRACFKSAIDEYTEFFRLIKVGLLNAEFMRLNDIFNEQ